MSSTPLPVGSDGQTPIVPKRVFVTGAGGFIGRALMQRYRDLGAEVCGVDVRADPGWNTVAEYRSVASSLEELSPNLLLLGFTLNDAEPINPQKVAELRSTMRRREPQLGLSVFLVQRSQLYSLAWDRLENTRLHRAYATYYHSLFEGPDWKNCLGALKRLRDLTRDRSIPLVLLVFPIFDSPMDDSYSYRDLHDKMREAGRSLEIPVLNLLEAYRGVDVYRLAVEPFADAHPNECPSCKEKCDFLDSSCYTPDCSGEGTDQRIG